MCVRLGGNWAVRSLRLGVPAASRVFFRRGGRCSRGGCRPTGATEPPPGEAIQESGLHWFLRCSGLIGLFIFGLSVYFVALVIRLFMTMRTETAVPAGLADAFREQITREHLRGPTTSCATGTRS